MVEGCIWLVGEFFLELFAFRDVLRSGRTNHA